MATEPIKTGTTAEPTAEQKAAADKEAAEKLAAKTVSDARDAELKAYKDKEAKAAADLAATECNAAVKAAFGRDATTDEVSAYQGMNEGGRKVYKANLTETAANRDKLLTKAGLTQEQVNDTGLDANKGENNLILAAARTLGFAHPAK